MLQGLLNKRRQIKFFDQEVIPEQSTIQSILKKTYELVPSKQNLIPYKVHILGPEQKEIKDRIFFLASKNELPDTFEKERLEKKDKGQIQLRAPYVLLFEKRCPEPNQFILNNIGIGLTYSECDPKKHNDFKTAPAIEIGMFISILTGLCVEQDIDISYTLCLPSVTNKNGETINPFKDYNINFIDNYVFIAVSLGYRVSNEKYKGYILARDTNEGETKPPISNILRWHND